VVGQNWQHKAKIKTVGGRITKPSTLRKPLRRTTLMPFRLLQALCALAEGFVVPKQNEGQFWQNYKSIKKRKPHRPYKKQRR
jgi:hypothetical protein